MHSPALCKYCLFVCTERKLQREKYFYIFHNSFSPSKNGEESTALQNRINKCRIRENAHFYRKSSSGRKRTDITWLLKLELKFWAFRQAKEMGNINSEWFPLLVKRKQQSFSGEISYYLYFDWKYISLFVNVQYVILLASLRSLEDF